MNTPLTWPIAQHLFDKHNIYVSVEPYIKFNNSIAYLYKIFVNGILKESSPIDYDTPYEAFHFGLLSSQQYI